MKPRQLGTVFAALCVAAGAKADIEGVRLGTDAPPGSIGGMTVVPFPYDDRIFADVLLIPDSFGRSLQVNPASSCREVGFGWATWSHSYSGNVYYPNAALDATLTLPPGTKAFCLYVESNPYGVYDMTVTASDGVDSVTFMEGVEGRAGAAGWAFYGTDGSEVVTIHVHGEVDFAFGEFSISEPCPADLDLDGFVDFTDFLLFLNYYDAGDLRVDYTEDGLVDFADYLLFLNWYGNSCEDD